jgi:hypothetical protein
MQLLVSLCNKSENAALLHPAGFLYRIDVSDRRIEPVDLGFLDSTDAHGTTGLARHRNGLAVAVQSTMAQGLRHEPSKVMILDADLGMKQVLDLPQVSDLHSLMSVEGVLHVVSTGTDSVVTVDESGHVETVLDATKSGANSIHLNSVVIHEGRLLYSAFGTGTDALRRSAQEGYIFDQAAGRKLVEGVHHPHSLVSHGGMLYFCESGTATAHCTDGSSIQLAEGYVRGLAVSDEFVALGISRQRTKSRSSGNNVFVPFPEKEGRCEVLVYRKNEGLADAELVDVIGLEHVGDEIYDILIA